MKWKPGNIWSGSKRLAVLTNPTDLAYRKGNLEKKYPVIFRGKTYADVEEIYKEFKGGMESMEKIMEEGIVCKLIQYPRITEMILNSGGSKFLESCSHKVYGKSWWEGEGIESPFIRVLIRAYETVV